ncbi:hypothetical protein N7447_001881, partial [Penicillium robsamsonii]|uniref:uncharacterized protein n=1 Tax=Penicillium robsamsonii TaxID=1792511 RepID=UPI00254731EA
DALKGLSKQISYFFNFTEAYEAQKFSSLRTAADHYRVSYSKLRGRKNKNGRLSLSDRPTTNNALNSNQEKALKMLQIAC